jgi:hypothetical protein
MSAGDVRALAGSIQPRSVSALAQRVPRCHTNAINPRNPPCVLLVCIQSREIRAVAILADTVGAAAVTIPVCRQDPPIREVGGSAVSALVWPVGGVNGLSTGITPGGGVNGLSIGITRGVGFPNLSLHTKRR